MLWHMTDKDRTTERRVRLSKSRFVAGGQCHKLLWWKVHEPAAGELQVGKVLQDLFDQGVIVGKLATDQFPGGVLIDLPHQAVAERVTATQTALDAGAPAIFEASFFADRVFVAVDVLLKTGTGHTLIEVKSSTEVKDEHIADAAIQAWVLSRSGVAVDRVEIMHLNKEYRHPGQGPLLVREDVTERIEAWQVRIPKMVAAQLAMLEGPLPEVAVGAQCWEPRECPFFERCWSQDPDHIRNLYSTGAKKTVAYIGQGIHRISDLAPAAKLSDTARRQIRAMKEQRLIVEPTLARALEGFDRPLGYLDFETVARAVPVWDGLAPWGQATAQFSFHEELPDGTHRHVGWLAEGPHDPRRELAEAMIAATKGARRIVTYSAFEKTRIGELKRLVPELADPLQDLLDKLVDLLPVVRNHVYHPDFGGSFSLKAILNPLVPSLSYQDLVIVDGMVASVEIARLLFVAHRIPVAERDRLRQDLLDYCERDTWATVELMRTLRTLAGA